MQATSPFLHLVKRELTVISNMCHEPDSLCSSSSSIEDRLNQLRQVPIFSVQTGVLLAQ